MLILSSAAPSADQRRLRDRCPIRRRVAEAEQKVRKGEERLARQLVLIRKLKIAGRHDEAEAARDLPPELSDLLRAARQHLQIERETNGIGC
jgi:hypothetical protein